MYTLLITHGVFGDLDVLSLLLISEHTSKYDGPRTAFVYYSISTICF